jgi:hypothetical protein
MTGIPQEAALTRQLYADGHSVADILAKTQLTHGSITGSTVVPACCRRCRAGAWSAAVLPAPANA